MNNRCIILDISMIYKMILLADVDQFNTVKNIGYTAKNVESINIFQGTFIPKETLNMRQLRILLAGQISKHVANNISNLQNILALSSYNSSLEELSFLQNLKRLTIFHMCANKVVNISDIKNLREIVIYSNKYKIDANNLLQAKFLESLHIRNSKVESISCTQYLTQLRYIEVSKMKLDSCSFLSTLINLEKINISKNRISDIHPLINLKKLTSLKADNNRICNIQPITELPNLKGIYLYKNNIKHFDAKMFNKVKYLVLHGNKNITCYNLSCCGNLITLTLSKTTISSNMKNDIAKIPTLETINFSSCELDDLSFLSKLVSIRVLALARNKIKDISSLANLTNLVNLQVNNNIIMDLRASTIKNLTSISNLCVNCNKIRDISALKLLTNLKSLNISNNYIRDITPIIKLVNLITIRLKYNPIDYGICTGINISTSSRGYSEYVNGYSKKYKPYSINK